VCWSGKLFEKQLPVVSCQLSDEGCSGAWLMLIAPLIFRQTLETSEIYRRRWCKQSSYF